MKKNQSTKSFHERKEEDGRRKGFRRKTIFSRGKALAGDKSGNSTPTIIVLILGLLFLVCAMSEFFRLMIIAQGVRDGLQQAVITVATTNYDETYRGLREGYSGGYRLSGEQWVEDLDYDDVYYRLDSLLGTERDGSCQPEHTKPQENQPQGGDTNPAGAVYVPGFGYIENSGPNEQGTSHTDGDWNKQIGTMQ